MSWEEIKSTVDWMSVCRFTVSMAVVIGFLILAVMVFFADVSDIGQAGMLILGAMVAAFTQVIGYYLGSSSGSAVKDKIIRGPK